MTSPISKDLRNTANMINMGEQIAWGSETALMDKAADRIDELEAALDSEHSSVGFNIWRFWSDKAREIAAKNADLRKEVAELKDRIEEMYELAAGEDI